MVWGEMSVARRREWEIRGWRKVDCDVRDEWEVDV